jgi:hypothetical protein
VRAAVLIHGRYSRIERELEALARGQMADFRQLASTTRDRLMRSLYASAANSTPSAEMLDRVRDLLIGHGLQK